MWQLLITNSVGLLLVRKPSAAHVLLVYEIDVPHIEQESKSDTARIYEISLDIDLLLKAIKQ